MQNFTLKFGKYKGQQFANTPKSYQDWLIKQDWFKMPKQLDALGTAEKTLSELGRKLKSWNGYSAKGQAVYEQMFEAEKAMDNAIFNSHDEHSLFWDGTSSWER
jgi:uncharacterized protein (DUF3820 family)